VKILETVGCCSNSVALGVVKLKLFSKRFVESILVVLSSQLFLIGSFLCIESGINLLLVSLVCEDIVLIIRSLSSTGVLASEVLHHLRLSELILSIWSLVSFTTSECNSFL